MQQLQVLHSKTEEKVGRSSGDISYIYWNYPYTIGFSKKNNNSPQYLYNMPSSYL